IRHRCLFLAGIELDPEAAKEGAQFFDAPVVGDLLEGLRGPWDAPFDVVVAGDVLEHLPDPEVALEVLRPLLAKGGSLLESHPTAANVRLLWALSPGRLNYGARGFVDRTPLRSSTMKPARRLLPERGFTVISEPPTAMPLELGLPLLARRPFAAPA